MFKGANLGGGRHADHAGRFTGNPGGHRQQVAKSDALLARVAERNSLGNEIICRAVQIDLQSMRKLSLAAVFEEDAPGRTGERFRARPDIKAGVWEHVEGVLLPDQKPAADNCNPVGFTAVKVGVVLQRPIQQFRMDARG